MAGIPPCCAVTVGVIEQHQTAKAAADDDGDWNGDGDGDDDGGQVSFAECHFSCCRCGVTTL